MVLLTRVAWLGAVLLALCMPAGVVLSGTGALGREAYRVSMTEADNTCHSHMCVQL